MDNNNQTNTNIGNLASNISDEGGINFKQIIGKFLSFLPYFILSLSISLTVAFLINRYSNPAYLVKATLLIKEKNSRTGMDGADGFLQGMQLLSTIKNI
jgi:hypothetical protein